MYDVVLLSLSDGAGCGGACACGGGAPRAQVMACADVLKAEGATVSTPTACSDQEIDAVIARLDGPARPDGLTWPASDGPRLIVATAADGQVRAVVRRMVRRYAPPPSRRPADLAAGRTVPDLPPIGILPLNRPAEFGTPGTPEEVAKAVLGGAVQRLDLLRNDGGSVTLQGALLGGQERWAARVEVDDSVLASPGEQIVACAIANDDGYAVVDGLPMATGADPTDGQVNVAVAVPVVTRSRLGRQRVRVEVRRASGRAVAVTPLSEIDFIDDGVGGTLGRKRSWWTERGAWGVYRS
ncbi:hypothetical protein GCM10023322_01060 [Rugosimonospora acidiphila]|uniref:DAGKc domain-containing protein n=1 Tax=Rugosimonospora acidiphila TaxID=556531 RepID=A0ABP9RH65_9ACTN